MREDGGSAVRELWELTKTDWHATVSVIITEPVCAMVDLEPDDDKYPALRGFIGTQDANESIRRACEYHLRTLRMTPSTADALLKARGVE